MIAVATTCPINPATGAVRYNTDTHQMELFDGANWQIVGEQLTQTAPWKKWFAWYPVRVNGKHKWFKTVYRRVTNTYVNHDDWKQYEYGTIFDVIKDAK